MWAAIIQLVASALTNAAGSIVQGEMKKNAQLQGIKDLTMANQLYSGDALNQSMTNEGIKQAQTSAQMSGDIDASNIKTGNVAPVNAAMPKTDVLSEGLSGYSSGAERAKQTANANYLNATAAARRNMEQAGINSDAVNQIMQGANKTGSSLIDMFKSTSDENEKTYNNESGLPKADIQDSLRQLETVLYQYKHPEKEGEDGEDHVGFTAQSAEKTPLFNDAVVTNDEGIKQIDKWKLMESLAVAEAELQREIDELEKEDKNEPESEETAD